MTNGLQLAGWFFWSLVLLVVALLLFALPSRIEGPVLLRISQDHAIAVLDAVAIVPLFVANVLLFGGMWGARRLLRETVQSRPRASVGLASVAGFGLGLLLAAVFANFAGWWAIGAVLFTTAMLIAAAHLGHQGKAS